METLIIGLKNPIPLMIIIAGIFSVVMLITGIIKRQGDTKRTILISLLASFSPVLLLFILIKVNDWLVIWLTKSQMAMPIAIGALFLAFSLLLAQYIIRVYDIYSLYKTKPTKEIDD